MFVFDHLGQRCFPISGGVVLLVIFCTSAAIAPIGNRRSKVEPPVFLLGGGGILFLRRPLSHNGFVSKLGPLLPKMKPALILDSDPTPTNIFLGPMGMRRNTVGSQNLLQQVYPEKKTCWHGLLPARQHFGTARLLT